MINIGKLKLEILTLAEPVQELVQGIVRALHADDRDAAHEAVEAAFRTQFEIRQALRHRAKGSEPEAEPQQEPNQ